MRKLLRTKKGLIPTTDIISTIVNGIRSLISWFLQVTPKPLLFLLFLMFILLLGSFIVPLMINGMGYHCDTSSVVWKISGLQLFTNFDIMRHKPELDANYMGIPFICDGGSGKDGKVMGLCTNCSRETNATLNTYAFCLGDGYRLPEYPYWSQKLECEWLRCAPPEDYFYNYTEDKFQCAEAWCINATMDDYNQRIYSVDGATPVYRDTSGNYSSLNLIYFKCKENDPTNIRLTFFGLDVFDYKTWIALATIGILLTFYSKYR